VLAPHNSGQLLSLRPQFVIRNDLAPVCPLKRNSGVGCTADCYNFEPCPDATVGLPPELFQSPNRLAHQEKAKERHYCELLTDRAWKAAANE
jgi:hypothetical protein